MGAIVVHTTITCVCLLGIIAISIIALRRWGVL